MQIGNKQELKGKNEGSTTDDLLLKKGSSFKTTLINLAFALKNNCLVQPFFSRQKLEFQGYQKVSLLGSTYDYQTRQEFFNAFEKIIWFSYRQLPQCQDVGWGCMIRVIQMLVAQAITRDQPQLHPDVVISLFRDERAGPLALSTLCKMGQLGPRWTSCPEMLSIVGSVLAELKQKGKIKFGFEVFCDRLEIGSPLEYQEKEFPNVITVQTRVGEGKTIPEDYVFHLLQLAKDKRFLGMASGQNSQALYVVGTFQKLAVILDPHYVQEQESFSTFFCRNPQGIQFSQLSSSIAISYYLSSWQDFQEWVGELLYAKRLSVPYCCFSLSVEEEELWFSTGRKGSDDFQLL